MKHVDRDTLLPPRTLAELRSRIEADPTLAEKRRDRGLYAISSISRWKGMPPEATPANPDALAADIERLHPALLGITAKRIQNVIADLRYVVRRYWRPLPRRHNGLTSSWTALLETTPEYIHYKLSRFGRFCSAREIEPETVSDDILQEYLDWLATELVQHRKSLVRETAKAWCRAVATIPDWPTCSLAVPNFRKDPTTIPLEAFPKSFQTDFADLKESLRPSSPFARPKPKADPTPDATDYVSPFRTLGRNTGGAGPTPPKKPLGKRTAEMWLRFFHYTASQRVRLGTPIDTITSVAKVVDPLAAREVLLFYYRRNGDEPCKFTSTLAYVIKRIAQIHCGVTSDEIDLHRENFAVMSPRDEGLTPKNAERLRQFDNDRAKFLLLNAPEALVARAEKKATTGPHAQIDLEVAAAVAIEIYAPIRLANLASITIGPGGDLRFREGKGGKLIAHLHIDGHRVKNGETLDLELPNEAVRVIKKYMEHGRPRLMDPSLPRLFPSHCTDGYFSFKISDRLREVTGLQINVHLFRHIAAKFWLDDHPGQYETVRILLGHKKIDTTVKFYCGFERKKAIELYDNEVLGLKDRLTKTHTLTKPRARRSTKKQVAPIGWASSRSSS